MSKIDTSSWKKFKISDLFDVKKGKRLTQADMVPGNIRFIGATSMNNGETARIGNTEHIHPANTITVTYNGSVGEVFYQTEPFWASDDVNVLYPKFEMTEQTALFLISLIKKLAAKYSYTQKWVKDALEKDEIVLPVTAVEQPDWDYMQERIAELEQERIAELEQERIAELEQYLVATGLNDYTLTDEDLKTLSLSGFRGDEAGNLPAVAGLRKEMREFKMNKLFELLKVVKAKKSEVRPAPDEEFCVPVVYAKFGDNGIMYWGRKGEFTTYSNVISIVYNGVISAGKVYAQEDATGILAESYLIRVRNGDNIPFRANQYMAQVIEKVIYPHYSREFLAIWNNRVENEVITLPIQTDVTGRPAINPAKTYHPDGFVPDWDYMAAYIRAIEKLVIKDVVDFKDAFISKAKEAVGA